VEGKAKTCLLERDRVKAEVLACDLLYLIKKGNSVKIQTKEEL